MTDAPPGRAPDPTARGAESIARRTTRLLDRGWHRSLRASDAAVAASLAALTVARSGVALGRSDTAAVLQITESFPTPVLDWRSNSVLGPALGHLAGVSTPTGWFVLHGVVVAALAVVVWHLTRRRFPAVEGRRVALAWVALGSLPPVLLQRIGSYDPYTALGAFLAVWGSSPAAAALGGALVGATSAEQGVLALGGAVVLVTALGPRRPVETLRTDPLVHRLAAAAGGLLVARALVLAWFAAQGADVPSRASVAGDLLGESLRNAASSAGAGLYAWFGLAWLLVLVAWPLLGWSRRRAAAVAASLLLPAAAAWATTLDGTRVFVMVSLPAYLVLLAHVVDRLPSAADDDRRLVRRLTVGALVASPLVPALVAEPSGAPYLVFPWGR